MSRAGPLLRLLKAGARAEVLRAGKRAMRSFLAHYRAVKAEKEAK